MFGCRPNQEISTGATSDTLEVTLEDFEERQQKFAASARATRRWKLLKNVRVAVRRTSLTPEEAELLRKLGKNTNTAETKKKRNADEESSESSFDGNAPFTSLPDCPDLSASPEPTPLDSARNSLRSSISRKRSSLSLSEATFLQALVVSKDIGGEALLNSTKVLENDVLYKTHKEDMATFRGGPLDMSSISTIDMSTHRICEDCSEDASDDDITGEDADGVLLADTSKTQRDAQQKERDQNDAALRREIWKDCPRSSFHEKADEPKTTDDANKAPEKSTAINLNTDSLASYLQCFVVSAMGGEKEATPTCITLSEEEGKDKEEQKAETKKKLVTVPFSILGASPEDAVQHVLSPPLMDAISRHMPYAVKEDNFWLKYSLARDGASLDVILSYVRTSTNTIVAIETTEGEVFGSFTSTAWRHMGNNYYGSGESFLWRLHDSRQKACKSLLERVDLESKIEVFKWSGKNRNVQLANQKKIVVGGGEPDEDINHRLASGEDVKKSKVEEEWTFGLALNSDLSSGTSGRCATFDSPCLSKAGSIFEVSNMEVWTMTPLEDTAEAEKLELGRHFVFASTVHAASKKPKQQQVTKVSRAA